MLTPNKLTINLHKTSRQHTPKAVTRSCQAIAIGNNLNLKSKVTIWVFAVCGWLGGLSGGHQIGLETFRWSFGFGRWKISRSASTRVKRQPATSNIQHATTNKPTNQQPTTEKPQAATQRRQQSKNERAAEVNKSNWFIGIDDWGAPES